ncbi:ketopantoate reductase family protein [Nocardiopsis sp. HNM0947]|uniref:2-dehydropantoate 2-reductase n=1 Tax=Nocardiopsis coralli TaxID=2772213 RepID=A0ABR9P9C9_9ACTN|nr:ketopantoate reductase family protein [Nocardiopsis coralli]MBE3000437.1 ketopantoate reductase family protein [Nocardiopsis coralli]
MRILVVGAGAVGGYFGARLVQAGRDVDFLVRPARAEALRERGLVLRDPDGAEETVHVDTVTADRVGPDYDLVIVAVKSYAFDPALEDLAPAVGPKTVVLPFLNGMSHIDTLVDRFGAERVYGGVAMVMTRLGENGEIVQIGPLAELIHGPVAPDPVVAPEQVREALDTGRFDSRPTDRAVQELWDKWVLLASLGACTCLMRGTIGEINRAPGGAAFTRAVLAESCAIAAASGYPIAEETRARTEKIVGSTRAPTTTSMYWDLTHGNPVEDEHIVGDLVRRGGELGVPTPLLEVARTHLAVYSAQRQGS